MVLTLADRLRLRGGPVCAGSSWNPSSAASRGRALRAEAAHKRPLGLRHSSYSHSPRPKAARDSSPRCNSPRSQFAVSGFKMRRPTRTNLVLHG